jgi:hypothetical protein
LCVKTNDYENFEKGMIYMEILKKRGGSKEKGGGGNEIHAPRLNVSFIVKFTFVMIQPWNIGVC